jgi:hypothetical protein
LEKSDLGDWKRHPVTQEVFAELRMRIEGLKEEIADGVLDVDPKQLAFKAGAIQAFKDVLETDF